MKPSRELEKRFYLSDEEVAKFHEQGYLGPFTLYEPEEITAKLAELRPELVNSKRSIYQGTEAISGATNISNYDRHLDISFLADHICRREIVDRLAGLLGPDILCWRTEFFPKYPGDEGTDWHQAADFSGIAGEKKPQILWPPGSKFQGTITVWTAFTESTEDNGCLQIMPGTHTTMYYDESKVMTYDEHAINSKVKNEVKRGFFGYDYRQLQVDPDWKPDESKAVNLVMAPGQFMIFWSTLMHASLPHRGATPHMRLGYAARYVPTSVRVYPYSDGLSEFGGNVSLDKHGSVLVCGRDEYQHNRLVTETAFGKRFPTVSHAGSAAGGPASVEEALVAICRTLLEREDVSVASNIYDLGATSLTAIRLLARIEEVFQCNGLEEVVFKDGSLRAVCGSIAQKRAGEEAL